MIHALLVPVLFAQVGAGLPPDSVATMRRHALAAESRFERLTRSLAPHAWDRGGSSTCDEVVGRFCLTFDSTTQQPSAPEARAVIEARGQAVEAMRRYFGAAPTERTAAGPLVRLLVLDGRATEALSAAEAFSILSGDSLWSELLLGYAAHAAGRHDAAEARFRRALVLLPPSDAEEWLDIEWLLEPRERSQRRRLTPDGRAEYDRHFWLYADPFWMTTANEFWIEQMARRVESRLLSRVPVVAGMLSWGPDLEELTVRYGIPKARARVAGGMSSAGHMVEYFDSTQRAYAPAERLTRGYPEPPGPGEKPPMFAAKARSAYAWGQAGVMHLDHQATRFVDGNRVVLRIDGVVRRDSVSRDAGGAASLAVYDSSFRRRTGSAAPLDWSGDSAVISLVAELPDGVVIYSVEALDTLSPAASHARYPLEAGIPATGPVLSDLLIGRPHPAGALPRGYEDASLAPLTSLVITAGDTLGLLAELYRAGPAMIVDVSLGPADGPSLLGRAARWVGRATGLTGAESYPRVSWRLDRSGSGTEVIALNLPIDARLDGRYRVEVRITDVATRAETFSVREILVKR